MTQKPKKLQQHTVVALVYDKPGVLNRVVSMVRRRAFNIGSLAVSHSETPGLSRMTFVIEGDDTVQEQVTKQLRKLVDVVKVSDLKGANAVYRELSLVRVSATAATRSEIIQIVEIFRANIVDVGHDSLIIEITGDEEKLESFVTLLKPFGVLEIMRSGRLAMVRGVSPEPNANGSSEKADSTLANDVQWAREDSSQAKPTPLLPPG
ncbi:MAG: acetolactate synthase small subunit [Chloroflexota bacterium]|nr:acetolactate synthase small subunit [Chloroflexota bacterium]